MKKLLLSGAVVLAFVVYALRGHFSHDEVNVVPPPSLSGGTTSSDNSGGTSAPHETTNPGATNPTPTPTPKPTPTPIPTPTGYKNGTFTGSVADAFYGPLQVQAVISGGKIVDVKFLQYPNDRPTSVEVNSQAMPYLKAEAIQAQTSQIDIVSGATQSSEAFRISMAAALALAK